MLVKFPYRPLGIFDQLDSGKIERIQYGPSYETRANFLVEKNFKVEGTVVMS